MKRRPPRSTRTDTLFPYTTLFRSGELAQHVLQDPAVAVVVGLLRGVDAHRGGERDLAGPHLEPAWHRVALAEAGQADHVDHLVAGQAERLRRLPRSEARRVGKEGVRTCRSRGSANH